MKYVKIVISLCSSPPRVGSTEEEILKTQIAYYMQKHQYILATERIGEFRRKYSDSPNRAHVWGPNDSMVYWT